MIPCQLWTVNAQSLRGLRVFLPSRSEILDSGQPGFYGYVEKCFAILVGFVNLDFFYSRDFRNFWLILNL